MDPSFFSSFLSQNNPSNCLTEVTTTSLYNMVEQATSTSSETLLRTARVGGSDWLKTRRRISHGRAMGWERSNEGTRIVRVVSNKSGRKGTHC